VLVQNNHLAIDINTVAVRFTKWNDGELVDEKTSTFVEQNDALYKSQLEEFWNSTGWKSTDFAEVSLSWSEKQTTLVPTNVFNESDKNAIFSLSFGSPQGEVDYNRIAVPHVVNVYAIPFWVKSFFVIRFPRIVIQHEGTYLLRGLYAQARKEYKSQLVVHQNHFLLACTKGDDLVFYSSFEWLNERDIVYYYSFFLQQQHILPTKHQLDLCCGVGASVDRDLLKRFTIVRICCVMWII